MTDPRYPSLHGWNQPQSIGDQMYPGLGDPFSPPSLFNNSTGFPSQGSSKFADLMSNLSEWKQMLDRMGGIDGVLNTVGKIQKIFSTVQQMAPLLRLLIGKNNNVATVEESAEHRFAGRRKRKNRRKTAKRSGRRR